jgi:HEAT repeat protein
MTEETGHDITNRGENPGASAKPALEELLISLQDNDKKTRLAAITLLAAIRDERSFHPMVGLLTDRHDDVRLTAARALGNLGDVRAVEPLTRASADENCFVRVMAREAITKILCGQQEPSCR